MTVGILVQVHGTWADLQDTPFLVAEVTWFADGSSFMQDGWRYSGAAVMSKKEVIWAEASPIETSTQRAEQVALTKALTLGKDKKLNIYTDSMPLQLLMFTWQ